MVCAPRAHTRRMQRALHAHNTYMCCAVLFQYQYSTTAPVHCPALLLLMTLLLVFQSPAPMLLMHAQLLSVQGQQTLDACIGHSSSISISSRARAW